MQKERIWENSSWKHSQRQHVLVASKRHQHSSDCTLVEEVAQQLAIDHTSHMHLLLPQRTPRREAMPTSQASPDYFGVTVRSCRRCQMSSYVFSTLWHSLNMFMLLNANQVKKHKYVIIIRIYDMISCSTARRDFTWIRVPQHQSSLLVVTS